MSEEDIQQGLDEMFESSIDRDDLSKTEQEMLSPAGTYTTKPALLMRLFEVEKGDNKGRRMIRYFGAAHSDKANAEGRFGFAISPIRVNKVDGSPDLPTKLWAMAVRAHDTAYGQKAESVKQVAEFIRDYPVNLRVIQMGVPTESNPEPQGEPGNLVVAISAVRNE